MIYPVKQILFALFLLLSLAACGSGGSAEKTEDKSAEIGQVQPTEAAANMPSRSQEEGTVIKARYIGFEFGDLPHFEFENIASNERISFTFMETEDDADLIIELPEEEINESNQGFAVNPATLGKTFEIRYTMEEKEYMDIELGEVEVVKAIKQLD